MIARDPLIFSVPLRSAGTVRWPNNSCCIGACSGGGHSHTRYRSPLSCNAFSTAAHGCEFGTT
jgi:hypothetical protein